MCAVGPCQSGCCLLLSLSAFVWTETLNTLTARVATGAVAVMQPIVQPGTGGLCHQSTVSVEALSNTLPPKTAGVFGLAVVSAMSVVYLPQALYPTPPPSFHAGAIDTGGRWYMGREWDRVFDVEMDSGLKLKLAMDEGENPYIVADRFLGQHDLPAEFKEQVISSSGR